jgi:hypothetical protein
MEHIRIKSANYRFLTELAKVRGQNVEDVLDRIVVEWAATVARKKMHPDAIPTPVPVAHTTGANGLNATAKKSTPGRVIEIPRKPLTAHPAAVSASGSRGPAAVLHF